jgi:hypothetical protein
MGGFVLGMGAMLDGGPIDKLFNAKKTKRLLNAFFEHILRGEPSPQAALPGRAAEVARVRRAAVGDGRKQRHRQAHESACRKNRCECVKGCGAIALP